MRATQVKKQRKRLGEEEGSPIPNHLSRVVEPSRPLLGQQPSDTLLNALLSSPFVPILLIFPFGAVSRSPTAASVAPGGAEEGYSLLLRPVLLLLLHGHSFAPHRGSSPNAATPGTYALPGPLRAELRPQQALLVISRPPTLHWPRQDLADFRASGSFAGKVVTPGLSFLPRNFASPNPLAAQTPSGLPSCKHIRPSWLGRSISLDYKSHSKRLPASG